MKKEPTAHLFFPDPGPKEQFVDKISNVFNSELSLLNEDYDMRRWGFEVLGFFFILKLNLRNQDDPLQSFFSLTMQPLSRLEPAGESEYISLDDHFKAFLKDAGFGNILTEEEFGLYLDELGFD